jgi:putative transposase
MDQFTRRMVGFGVQGGIVDGPALCRMFNRAIRGQTTPNYLSTDNDPLYRFHQWQAASHTACFCPACDVHERSRGIGR